MEKQLLIINVKLIRYQFWCTRRALSISKAIWQYKLLIPMWNREDPC
jgi:hypothetical protein